MLYIILKSLLCHLQPIFIIYGSYYWYFQCKYWLPKTRTPLNTLQMKVCICCKMSLIRPRIQKNTVKNQKPNKPYLVPRGDHWKTTQVIKVPRVKRAPISDIAKEMVMVHNNRYLLDRYRIHHRSRWSVEQKYFK